MTSISNLLKQKWQHSILKNLLHIEIPLIQSPMAGGLTTPELIAAVSNAGAMGSLGAGLLDPNELQIAIKAIRQHTQRPFAVNLFVPGNYQTSLPQQQQMVDKLNQVCQPLNISIIPIDPPFAPVFDEQMEIIIKEKISTFSFTFGIPSSYWIEKLKHNGTIIIGTATSLVEATALESAGVDLIVAQSIEAGGHRGTFIGEVQDSLIGAFSLIPLLVDKINLPIIAAGGIMDARAITAALSLGASGVQMGTAFLSCAEAGTHPVYKNKLINATNDETILTKAFSGKYARAIHNQFIDELSQLTVEFLDYPVQNTLTKKIRKSAAVQNNPEFMSLFAGQSTFLSTELAAADLVDKIKKAMIHLIG